MSLRLLIVTAALLLATPLLASESALWLVARDFDARLTAPAPGPAPRSVRRRPGETTPAARRIVVIKVGRPGLPQCPR